MQSVYLNQMKEFQVGEDSPVFPGLFPYCQVGSLQRNWPVILYNSIRAYYFSLHLKLSFSQPAYVLISRKLI